MLTLFCFSAGCSSARLEYASGGRVVASSNLVIPTINKDQLFDFSNDWSLFVLQFVLQFVLLFNFYVHIYLIINNCYICFVKNSTPKYGRFYNTATIKYSSLSLLFCITLCFALINSYSVEDNKQNYFIQPNAGSIWETQNLPIQYLCTPTRQIIISDGRHSVNYGFSAFYLLKANTLKIAQRISKMTKPVFLPELAELKTCLLYPFHGFW